MLKWVRRVLAVIGGLFFMAIVLPATVSASSANTYPVHTKHGGPVNVRSGPGLEFPVVDHVRNGQRVTIHCTTTTAGTVWDDISGHGRFVSDDYIKTGTSDPVAPPCNTPDPAASGPSPAAADHADAETAPAPAPPEQARAWSCRICIPLSTAHWRPRSDHSWGDT